jgi:hypothetical protein
VREHILVPLPEDVPQFAIANQFFLNIALDRFSVDEFSCSVSVFGRKDEEERECEGPSCDASRPSSPVFTGCEFGSNPNFAAELVPFFVRNSKRG